MNTGWEVGDGCTVGYVSDYYPFTVIEVTKSGRQITIQQDQTVKVGGEWPNFKYQMVTNPTGRTMTFTLRKNGVWRQKGDDMRHTGARLLVGQRYYIDPHF